MSVRVLLSMLLLAVALSSITILFYSLLLSSTATLITSPPPLALVSLYRPKISYKIYQQISNTEIRSKFQTLKSYECKKKKTMLSEINVNNIYWQKVDTLNIYLYSAFYDVRYRYEGEKYNFVRIIVSSKGIISAARKRSVFCHLWYKNHPAATIVKADLKEIWIQSFNYNSPNNTYHSYLLTCPVPTQTRRVQPEHVSVSSYPCGPLTTLLPVQSAGLRELRRGFAKAPYVVCVKGMNFLNDVSDRLIEWLEINIILGADHVDLYVYYVHPKVRNVLEYYESIGYVNIIDISLPGDQPNGKADRTLYLKENLWQKRRNELIPYNDCLYRNMYMYNFIIPIDIDELLIPIKFRTWAEMLKNLFRENPKLLKKYSSISVPHVYFFTKGYKTESNISSNSEDKNNFKNNPIKLYTNVGNVDQKYSAIEKNIESKYHTLNHLIRSFNFSQTGHNVKSFVATKTTLLTFNHYALQPLLPNMTNNFVLSQKVMQLNHYQEKCSRYILTQCLKNFNRFSTKDDIMLKYEMELIASVDTTHTYLKTFKSNNTRRS